LIEATLKQMQAGEFSSSQIVTNVVAQVMKAKVGIFAKQCGFPYRKAR
jgi:hypothetical protein